MAGGATDRALSSVPSRRLRSGSLATSLTCMDKRTILALVLMALVIVITPRLFPSSRRAAPQPADSAQSDTARAAGSPTNATPTSSSAASNDPRAQQTPATPAANQTASAAPASASPVFRAADSATVVTSLERLTVVSPGAVPTAVHVSGYRNLRPDRRDTAATIAQPHGALLHYRLAVGADTIALDTVHFTIDHSGTTATLTSTAPAITI